MSMTRDQMMRYLDVPSALNDRTQGELREILDEFPYFQTAHLLYIRNLQNENNFRFAGQLKLCSVYATDRKILYRLLNSVPDRKRISNRPLEITAESGKKGSTMIELSDKQPENVENTGNRETSGAGYAENQPFDLLNFELTERSYWQEGIEDTIETHHIEIVKETGLLTDKNEPHTEPEKKYDLIDRFIRYNPAFTVKQPENSGIGRKFDPEADNISESDEFITETLARIYVKQGLYAKAINAFEKLSLKYPEKSVYFARQIEEVKKMINK